ncbi:MAG: GTP-binding protein, partial [Thermanaerothrix sp.]|nr:GTP-binding protein [Thermanaerothrix sp.]
MHVIGTAGHVDHGKSTLVAALTGIHPDRLKEEQAREMTIDLGFAWLTLPNGESVGIVDVPGHRDFIENMLAGVGGIDAALLVVAALFTSFYSWRLIFLTFHGRSRAEEHVMAHVHESPQVMLVPLYI